MGLACATVFSWLFHGQPYAKFTIETEFLCNNVPTWQNVPVIHLITRPTY